MSNMLRRIEREGFRQKYGKRFGAAWRQYREAMRAEAEKLRRAEMRRVALRNREREAADAERLEKAATAVMGARVAKRRAQLPAVTE